MYRSIEEFIGDYSRERESTLKIMKALNDTSLAQRANPESRPLGRMAWHVVTAVGEMMNRTGLEVKGPGDDAPVPATAAEIVAAYDATTSSLLEQVQTKWTTESLGVVVDMYGEQWPNAVTLQVLIRHEIHHRAQMTVLMRLAGLAVPGVYGPSREEWTAYGMPPQE